MAARSRQTDNYKLTGVKVSDQVVGYGPYTTDIQLEYRGLKCTGKKIHPPLFMQGETASKVRQLKEQCHLLYQLRHPNIVMFLGFHFQQSPILVTEFVPYNLGFCIEQYGLFPKEVSYSILLDVALGLSYLHSQVPSIIHGDLSANSIFLTPNMMAKVSYVDVPKILSLTQPEIVYISKTNNTSVYMPQELLTATCKIYESTIDIFSCGVLMIHMLTGKQPDPQVHPIKIEANTLAEAVGSEGVQKADDRDHPLMELILRCTNDSPQLRPQADEIVKLMTEMVSKFPNTFANRLQLLQQIGRNQQPATYEKEIMVMKGNVQEKKQQVLVQEQQLKILKAENEALRQQISRDCELINKTIRDLQQSQDHEKRKGSMRQEKGEAKAYSPNSKRTPRLPRKLKPPTKEEPVRINFKQCYYNIQCIAHCQACMLDQLLSVFPSFYRRKFQLWTVVRLLTNLHLLPRQVQPATIKLYCQLRTHVPSMSAT